MRTHRPVDAARKPHSGPQQTGSGALKRAAVHRRVGTSSTGLAVTAANGEWYPASHVARAQRVVAVEGDLVIGVVEDVDV